VKYKYCPACKKAYVKSRLEMDKCIYCGEMCEVVEVKKTPLYYVGYLVLIIGAVVIFLLRGLDTILLWLVFAFFLILGSILVIGASNKMAKEAAAMVSRERDEKED
jgi:uncharacterized protein (DUF983 family)